MSVNADGVSIRVKVVPGASRTRIAGLLGDRLKVQVAPPPEGGKANLAVCALLAQVLGVAPRNVTVVEGHSRPQKTLRVVGMSTEQVANRLVSGDAQKGRGH